MRNFLGVAFFCYALNFAAGYLAVRSHSADSRPACEKILTEAKGWTLIGVMLVMPGESNACLDLGYFPKK